MMVFAFNDNTLRQKTIDGEPWFVAADVCRCLGLETTTGTTTHLRKLADDERRLIRKGKVSDGRTLSIFMGFESQLVLVSESGLYKLIMRSDKPVAREFQDWVTRIVIPSIRKTGGYLLNEAARETAVADKREELPLPTDFLSSLLALVDTEKRRIAAVEMAEKMEQELEVSRPKAEQYDAFMSADGTYNLRRAAKILNIPERRFSAALVLDGILYRDGKDLLPIAEYQKAGWFVVRSGSNNDFAYQQVRFTPKGIAGTRKRLERLAA
jgi:prophage antirepressor-like protein